LNAVSNTLRGAKEMFSIESLGGETAHHPSIEIYKQRGDFVYGFMAAAKDSYDNLAARRPKLASFVTAASTANTPKAVQDLNVRIGAEMLLMLNDISMMQALTLTAMMEKESLDYNEAGLMSYRPTKTSGGEETTGGEGEGEWKMKYKGATKTY
jgi:type IV secretion system protein VirB5